MWPFKRRPSGRRLIATAITEGFKLMADTINDLITSLNDNTNLVAARIDRLIAALPVGTVVTADQVAQLQAVSDHLKALGSDPANPVPDAPPTAA